MKKVKVILSVFAVVLAIGGTFATQYESPLTVTAWEYNTVLGSCIEHEKVDCTTPNQDPCVINNITMREQDDFDTQCGQILGRPQ